MKEGESIIGSLYMSIDAWKRKVPTGRRLFHGKREVDLFPERKFEQAVSNWSETAKVQSVNLESL